MKASERLRAAAVRMLPAHAVAHICGNAGWAIDHGENVRIAILSSVRALALTGQWPKCIDERCAVEELVAAVRAA